MAVAAYHVHLKVGWFWSGRGMEIPLYLLPICLAILIRGGGALSIGRSGARSDRIDIAEARPGRHQGDVLTGGKTLLT